MSPLPSESELFYGLNLTEEQRSYVDSIFDNQLTIVNAKAGTGKTTLAVGAAKIIGKPLYYIFAPVEEDALGYTPGNVEEKEAKYIQPLLDALREIKEDYRFALHREEHPDHINKMAWVYAKSHVFARGTNIKGATVIIDESQNMTRGQLKKVLTRLHDNCTVIVIGHDAQCDLEDASKSGFVPYIEHFRGKDYCEVVELTKNFRGRLAKHADELSW